MSAEPLSSISRRRLMQRVQAVVVAEHQVRQGGQWKMQQMFDYLHTPETCPPRNLTPEPIDPPGLKGCATDHEHT